MKTTVKTLVSYRFPELAGFIGLTLILVLFAMASVPAHASTKKHNEAVDNAFNKCIQENLYAAAENLDSYDMKTNIKQIQEDLRECRKEASKIIKAQKAAKRKEAQKAKILAKIENLKKKLQ